MEDKHTMEIIKVGEGERQAGEVKGEDEYVDLGGSEGWKKGVSNECGLGLHRNIGCSIVIQAT